MLNMGNATDIHPKKQAKSLPKMHYTSSIFAKNKRNAAREVFWKNLN